MDAELEGRYDEAIEIYNTLIEQSTAKASGDDVAAAMTYVESDSESDRETNNYDEGANGKTDVISRYVANYHRRESKAKKNISDSSPDSLYYRKCEESLWDERSLECLRQLLDWKQVNIVFIVSFLILFSFYR